MVKALGTPALAEPASCAKVKPWIKPASELASCSKGRGQLITEKLQEIANMGPAAAYRYTGDEKSQKKNLVSKKPAFPTLEEKAACKQYEEGKDYDVNYQKESVGECYTSLKQQANRYDQEVRALPFFQWDDNVDLACRVLAIADWAEEFNGMSTHAVPDILPALQSMYSSPMQARGQFPLQPTLNETRVTDV